MPQHFNIAKTKKKKPKEDATYLHPGYVMAKCIVEKPCYHCKNKESHYQSLCLRPFKQKRPPSNSIFTANTVPFLVEDTGESQSMLATGRSTDNANSSN